MNSKPIFRSFRARFAKAPSLDSRWERLESRELLSTAYPMFAIGHLEQQSSPASSSYTPAQVQQAYQFNQISFGGIAGTGAGETIAIVDAYNDPDIQSDLNTFDDQFSLPAITITKVNQTGGTSLPSTDPTGGWELEESLDVEWAHAMAPAASILLVEASSSGTSDLLAGVGYAAAHANVVSMSWGTAEFSGETSYDSDFSRAGVAFVASSGDNGAPVSWPAASPNVLAVGGTALTLSANGTWSSEVGWSGSGGGPSADEPQPSYQSGVVTGTTMRTNPDVAYNASPSTGFAVFDSDPYEGTSYDWTTVGGTSAGAPQWAALLAIADQGRTLSAQAPLDSTNAQQVMDILYKTPGDFHDITSGTSTGTPNYTAEPGYDYVTGLGTPIANEVVGSLDANPALPPDTLVVSAPSTATAGNSFSFTVTAEKPGGAVDTAYTGTVQFTSTDGQAVLPIVYVFTVLNDGSHTFTVTLKTAGSQTITATALLGSAIAGTSAGIRVVPAAASQFVISGLSSSVTAGVARSFTIIAEDRFGNVAPGYTGTIHFSSSDAAATLPANYTFTTANAGSHAFTATFATAGSQSLTIKDTSSGITATQSGISVVPAAPFNLSATVVSTSQIDLTWGASSGDTGYLVERSANDGSSWTQVASISSGTTSDQDTGLSAGTTYEYRVVATGGGLDSAPSNVVTATTTDATVVTDSIWGNSYTPSENATSSGAYELGVKFTSSEAGEVTGIRFYKIASMNGYTHVGHLWSSSGALLATATFTNETSSGWQQITFSSPVAIAANTIYIASFSSSGGTFGTTTGYFTNGGVSNGPLQALPNSTPGGDGVYGNAGDFPDASGSGMNFWVDIAFTPSASPSVQSSSAPSTAASSSSTDGASRTARSSGYFVVPSTMPAPAEPPSFAGGSHAATAPAAQTSTPRLASRKYHRTTRQPRTIVIGSAEGPLTAR